MPDHEAALGWPKPGVVEAAFPGLQVVGAAASSIELASLPLALVAGVGWRKH